MLVSQAPKIVGLAGDFASAERRIFRESSSF
jgi:hypothetical protein